MKLSEWTGLRWLFRERKINDAQRAAAEQELSASSGTPSTAAKPKKTAAPKADSGMCWKPSQVSFGILGPGGIVKLRTASYKVQPNGWRRIRIV